MKRFEHILVIVMMAVVMLPLASCHTSRKNVASSTRRERTSRQTATPGVISDDWKTLNIKLRPGDNQRLYREVKGWLGVPYLYGGHTKSGSDCSGFVMEIFKTVYGKRIQRNSAKIFQLNCREIDRSALAEGDLVFFDTRRANTGSINHVGLYLRDNKFVHASSHGVVVADLNHNYWVAHWVAAGRVCR